MRKNILVLFILFSVGALSAQNINFSDTDGLKTLLCSHTWYRYYVNTDSTFSDRILDSIRFYANGTVYQSGRPIDDTIYDKYLLASITRDKWHLGSTGRTSRKDTATDCINIDGDRNKGWHYALIDGHRIKGSKYGKICRNLDKPFILGRWSQGGPYWDIHEIWQPPRKIKRTASIPDNLFSLKLPYI